MMSFWLGRERARKAASPVVTTAEARELNRARHYHPPRDDQTPGPSSWPQSVTKARTIEGLLHLLTRDHGFPGRQRRLPRARLCASRPARVARDVRERLGKYPIVHGRYLWDNPRPWDGDEPD